MAAYICIHVSFHFKGGEGGGSEPDRRGGKASIEKGVAEPFEMADYERQGTVWTATAHIITAVIGSGVLALAWSVAQLGWIAGPLALLGFSFATYYTSTLLADCYRSEHPIAGLRNRTYMDAVRSYLGPRKVFLCGVAQYANLWGAIFGYSITATTSMIAIKRADCFHRRGHDASCHGSGTMLMILFGVIQLVLSQFPNMEKITWLSVVAAATSFGYSLISLGLCIAKWATHGDFRGGIAGTAASSSATKTWNTLQALGNIAFAYTFAEVLIEIQDTLRSPPPENKTMKRATLYGIVVTTIFYLSLGCTGYAAFGDNAPGNILTGFGFYEPFWLVEIGNLCIIIHLFGAYQVYAQPIFAAVEKQVAYRWPKAKFVNMVCSFKVPFFECNPIHFTLSKLVLRSVLVTITTLVAMLLPFFNSVLGLLGALSFWPLTIYFPVNMHISKEGIKSGTSKWVMLKSLSTFCLLISLAVSIGSVADIVNSLKHSTPFKLEN